MQRSSGTSEKLHPRLVLGRKVASLDVGQSPSQSLRLDAYTARNGPRHPIALASLPCLDGDAEGSSAFRMTGGARRAPACGGGSGTRANHASSSRRPMAGAMASTLPPSGDGSRAALGESLPRPTSRPQSRATRTTTRTSATANATVSAVETPDRERGLGGPWSRSSPSAWRGSAPGHVGSCERRSFSG